MELVLISGVALVAFVSFVGAGLFAGFMAGLWYSRYYYDGSERDGTRKWPWLQRWCASNWLVAFMRRFWLRHTLRYMDAEGVVHDGVPDAYYERADTAGASIYAGHPHGLLAIASLLTVGIPKPGGGGTKCPMRWYAVRPCVHRHIFATPLVRDMALWLGAVDVTRENMQQMLLRGRSIYVAPGGCREMILDTAQPIQTRHRGFLEIAFREGCHVFPMLHRGQEVAFPSLTCALLDRMRASVLDAWGYPFPTLWVGPLPGRLTTVLLDPLDPSQYASEEAFVDAYFATLESNRLTLERQGL